MRRGQKTGAEQVVLKLRQIEVPTTRGKRSSLACKEAEISERSSCRWRTEYGGLQIDQARTMKDLERENARLRRLGADLSLEKQVLADVAAGNNGPERISKALRKWVAKTGSQFQDIAPGSPWENGYCESFDGKLKDELGQEIFYSLKEAQIVIGIWQNT